MEKKRILIVGGVAGGATCGARIRRLNEDCEIVIFEMGSYVSFANCGLPYFIGDVIVEEEKLLVATPALFENRFNIRVHTDTEVLFIDREHQRISVCDLKTSEQRHEHYDALVLSTGSQSVWPDINGLDLPGVHVLRTIPDSRQIKAQLENIQRAVVLGAGYLGLELAENLKKTGVEVTVVQSADQVMHSLDKEMAAYVADHLQQHGLEIKLSCKATAISQNPDQSLQVSLDSGESVKVDAVMVSIGVKPRAELAVQAGLEIGKHGGIRVNEYLQTSDPNIWAVGDVVEVKNVITGQWQLFPLAGPANKQGRLAATDIVRKKLNTIPSVPYHGVQGTTVCGLFGLTVATTGVNEKTLQQYPDIEYEKVYLHPSNHVGYYPGAKPIHIKMLYDARNGRVLGAQALGESGVARRIDVLAAFIQMNGTVYDLEEAELCYAPQFGATKDPVNLAGMIAANHLRGNHPLAKWENLADTHTQVTDEQDEVDQMLAFIMDDPYSQAQIVDVRTAPEFERKHIPHAVNIPLDSLRDRLHELSQEREIWVVCGVGQRSYNATRILQQHGFQVRNLSGGMQTYAKFEE
ncbi:MAG: FAD-dependent oxidoreductase [Gammaproteobacteria bacterium]|jgi:NADPH-dependent 2,4-dienoyl-CoA reductase/sulfur reductase-like enzyme/rhodanese-related sulfurtransferase|nr:FAD-dependent oxidoreductase [Gammaproteobacteria bacterium]MBT5221577.1 FAD-dependent oxidoreductase [Gammaproteobacteria bacterium]MBT5824785.1 FAD-dependent oxidoreductase [Gammaproteobacteria bacterium]MBT6419856.1 FAD-dependent oxidoreductase [Gammaproteobacteria bacterium]MBT6575798.1 FAD-dependent oxidoreductase [Gammaproteobacteria bacterium]